MRNFTHLWFKHLISDELFSRGIVEEEKPNNIKKSRTSESTSTPWRKQWEAGEVEISNRELLIKEQKGQKEEIKSGMITKERHVWFSFWNKLKKGWREYEEFSEI